MSRSSSGPVPPSSLEDRLRHLVRKHLGFDVEQLACNFFRADGRSGTPDLPAVRARAWVGRAPSCRVRLGRAFMLDAYTLQVVIDDARRLGRGARLDLVVARATPALVVETVRRRLAGLRRRGIDVHVRIERRRRAGATPCEA